MKSWIRLSLCLSVGLGSLASSVYATETVNLDPVELELADANISSPDDTLPTVTVQDQQDKNNKSYQGNMTRIGKTNALPKDIPQSVTIVSDQLIKDRNANTLKEALRNVAGLTFNAGEGGRIGDNITLRGYSAVGDLYLDGLRDMAQYNRETFNLEQVEVLRGSASMLYGRGSTGGVINQVSKKPEGYDEYEIQLTGGKPGYMRAVADLNKKIDDHQAFRLTGMFTKDYSFRNGPEYKRWGFAPSYTWGLGTKNEVNLSYYFLKENNIPDFGVPFFQGRPLDISVRKYYGMANADYERNLTSIITLAYLHRFNPNNTFRSVIRNADYYRDLRATAPRLAGTPSIITPATIINRQRQARGSVEHVITSQNEYNGKFATGPLKHDLLAGYELTWERAKRWTNFSPYTNPTTTVGDTDFKPFLPAGFDDSFRRVNYNYYHGLTNSLYTQDTVQIIPHLKLMGGTRFDHMHTHYDRPLPAGNLNRTDSVWSYRGGLLYQPNDFSTYYVSYGNSFNPSAELYQLDNRTANTPPEKSRNIEAGAKWDLLNGNLSLRTSVFRTEKTNERNTDLSLTNVSLLSGKRHTDGIELEAAGRLTRNWQIFSSMALMRSNIDKASGQQAGSQDKRPINTPNYTYGVWSTYTFKFLHGNWKIGVGLEGVGFRFANPNNTNLVPAYSRADCLLEYTIKNISAKLNVFNILNKKYYEGVYQGHVVPGTSRAAQLTLSYKF